MPTFETLRYIGRVRWFALEISYDGTHYAGWQRQPGQETIQGALEKALSTIADEKVSILGSGRTDAGVHARKQVASVSLETSMLEPEVMLRGVNALLPKDLSLDRVIEKTKPFHAISDSRSKRYRYFYTQERANHVFWRNFVWKLPFDVDDERIRACFKDLVGTHDFVSFATHGLTTKTSVRTIHEIEMGTLFPGISFLEFHADGFLRHMVRSLVGTLMEVGCAKRQPQDISRIIEDKDRTSAGLTAPAHGLMLWDVDY